MDSRVTAPDNKGLQVARQRVPYPRRAAGPEVESGATASVGSLCHAAERRLRRADHATRPGGEPREVG